MSASVYLWIGIIVSWPPAAAGMWLTWRLAKKQVQKVTDDQTRTLATMNRRQLRAMHPGQHPEDPGQGVLGA